MTRQRVWKVDPIDPRAPPLEVWDSLTAAEALEEFFRRVGRRVYLSSELPVYYPGERMFAPDVIAVLDVEPGERSGWVVSCEGKEEAEQRAERLAARLRELGVDPDEV